LSKQQEQFTQDRSSKKGEYLRFWRVVADYDVGGELIKGLVATDNCLA